MNARTYRKLRKSSNKDVKKVNEQKKYDKLRSDLIVGIADFTMYDDMFSLIKGMMAGAEILKLNEFPVDEFIKYEKK